MIDFLGFSISQSITTHEKASITILRMLITILITVESGYHCAVPELRRNISCFLIQYCLGCELVRYSLHMCWGSNLFQCFCLSEIDVVFIKCFLSIKMITWWLILHSVHQCIMFIDLHMTNHPCIPKTIPVWPEWIICYWIWLRVVNYN